MKIVLVFFIALLIQVSAYSQQFTFSKNSVTFRSDTMEVEQAFKFMGKVLPLQYRCETRYVIKDSIVYRKQYYLINRILNRTYVLENGKTRRVKF